MRVVIRADASIESGSGHIMRCLTLADKLKRTGASIEFICREHPGHMTSYIRQQGYLVYLLPLKPVTIIKDQYSHWLGDTSNNDSERCFEIIQKYHTDWVIVDHYAIDEQWESRIKPFTDHLLVIDDLANRKHNCDLLLDQTLQRQPTHYESLTPTSCTALCGSKFALLRSEFAKYRSNSLNNRDNQNKLSKLLIFLGGSDPHNINLKLINSLSKSDYSDKLDITLVLGAQSQHHQSIQQQIKKSHLSIHLLSNVQDMAKLMSESDFAIGAAGSSTWERACLGLPTIQLIIANNQKNIAHQLQLHNAAVTMHSVKELEHCLAELMKNSKQISANSAALVDGRGANRVIKAMFTLTHSPQQNQPHYIVASVGEWNQELFKLNAINLPGHWSLAQNRKEFNDLIIKGPTPKAIFFPHWRWLVPEKITSEIDCICFHMTKLPYGRGGSPLQNLILNGHQSTTLTALKMVNEMDAGPIYVQCPLSLQGSAEEIYTRSSQLVWKLINNIIKNKPTPVEQSGDPVYFTRRKPEQSLIPKQISTRKRYDFIRMLDAPGYPRAYEIINGNRIEYSNAHLEGDTLTATAHFITQERLHETG